jgi:hypothetical protein
MKLRWRCGIGVHMCNHAQSVLLVECSVASLFVLAPEMRRS